MYYYNARFTFKLPKLEPPFSASIIAASALSPVDLQRRKFGNYSHLRKRCLDPQLYMATIDEAIDPKVVQRLAAYSWFHGENVPEYDSDEHESRTKWKKKFGPQLVSRWTRTVCTESAAILRAVKEAVILQLNLGCEFILLPGPLTTMADTSLQLETEWIDAGLAVCNELGVDRPIHATLAIAEEILQIPPSTNPVVHSFSNQVASRDGLAGGYIVLEQADPNNYFWHSRNALASLLMLIDDIRRGSHKRVIVNYVGTFGLVASAAGADVWSSGYYLAQRRFSRRGATGRAHPRYLSMALAADIGLKNDLEELQRLGLAEKLMTPTNADRGLRSALKLGKGPSSVPEWTYSLGNVTAAKEHYYEVTLKAEQQLAAEAGAARLAWVQSWLSNAAAYAAQIKQRASTSATDLLHQKIWLDVFEDWRNYAKQ